MKITSITRFTRLTSITGNKDTDLLVLIKLDKESFAIFKNFQNKYIYKLFKNETLWKERLFKFYSEIYPEPGQSWKNLYLNLVYLLKKHNYNKENISFQNACERGHLDVVKYLINFSNKGFGSIDPASDENYAIGLACQYGHINVVKYLIGLPKNYNINPAGYNNYAIRYASACGHLSVVKYLTGLPKEYGISIGTSITWAKKNNRIDVVNYLLSLPKKSKE
jgi:ankyrin repeat protein